MVNMKVMLAIISLYFLFILGAILWSRYVKTGSIVPGLDEFFLASRNLSSWVLALTVMGSLFSAFIVVGLPGAVYQHGVGAAGFIIFSSMLFITVFLVFGQNDRYWPLGAQSS